VPENDAARIWPGFCASAELERQCRQKTFLLARFQFPAAGAVVIFPVENICCPRKRAVSNFQITFDVQLTGQRVGCVVAATWREGYKNNYPANTSAVKQSNQFGGALRFAIRAHAGSTSSVEALHRGSIRNRCGARKFANEGSCSRHWLDSDRW
jgi:hypothetical protein